MRALLLATAIGMATTCTSADETPPRTCKAEVDDGFTPLFDGKTLNGWQGATEGYAVEDGMLIAKKEGGGKLYTTRQFRDFVLRFEFKLEPGGNNGIAIRSPIVEKAPAYQGTEIQILDDSSPKYTRLKPYQFHGSIYGVVAAERGHLKPVGQWNCEEITCNGRRITVKVNGATVVDADLDKLGDETPDGREHPGLKRCEGYIGLLGHGHRVEFRNIRAKELMPASGGD